MSAPLFSPELQDLAPVHTDRWMAVIYNNDTTPYEIVIAQIMSSTGCDQTEAEIETWEAHHYGKCSIHFAAKEECDEVARQMTHIGVRTLVTREWEE